MTDALAWALAFVEQIVPYAIAVGVVRYSVKCFLSAAFGGWIKL